MKKKWMWFSGFCLVLSLIPGLIASAAAFEFLDGKLKLNGSVRNETGMRLKERIYHDSILETENGRAEEDKLSVMRSTFLMDGTYDMTDNLSFGFIFKSYYDAKWDLDDSIGTANEFNNNLSGWDSNDLRAGPDGDHLQSDISLREWFVKWRIGGLNIKAGQQQIVWGESDAIRISDIINPLDYSKDYTTTAYGLNWEDVRIPQRMIDMTYVVPESSHQYEVEVVLNPEDSRVNTYAPYGELYYTQGNSSLIATDFLMTNIFGLPGFLPFTSKSFDDAINAAIDDANPDSNSASFAGGMRLRGVFGGWDTHLFYYYQRVQNPVFTSSGNFSLAETGFPVPLPWDVFDENLGIKAHFPHISTVGGTFSYFDDITATVFRGELGFTPDCPYSGRRQGTTMVHVPGDYGYGGGSGGDIPGSWDGWFNSDLVYKDTLTYMLGFDRPTWISFLNDINTFFITGQFIHKMILDYDDTVKGENNKLLLSTVMGKDGFSDHQTMFTLKVDTKYYDDRIKPGVLVVWDVNGHDGYVKPSLRWNPNYDWSFEIGSLYFWADDYTSGPFGLVKDDDQIYGLIEYRF